MWPFRKKIRPRRLELRRHIPGRGGSPWNRLRQTGAIGAIAVAAGFFACAVLLDLLPPDPLPYRAGQYLPENAYSRVAFLRLPPERILEAQDDIRTSTPALFRLIPQAVDEIVNPLRGLPDTLKAATQPVEVPEGTRQRFAIKSAADLEAWHRLADPPAKDRFTRALDDLADALVRHALVRQEEARDQLRRKAEKVVLVRPDGREARGIAEMISLDKVANSSLPAELAAVFDPSVRGSVRQYLSAVLPRRAVYRYDDEATQGVIQEALAVIAARPPEHLYKRYAVGELLLSARRAAERAGAKPAGLGREDLSLLAAEHEAYLAAERENHPWQPRLRVLSRAALILLLTVLGCLYIATYQAKVVSSRWSAPAVAVVVLLAIALARALVLVLRLNPHAVVLPVLTAGIVMTIAHNRAFGLALGLLTAALVVLQLGMDLAMLLVLAAALTASLFALREIRTRTKVILTGVLAAAVTFAAIGAVGLASAAPWRFVLADSAWGASVALLVGFLVQGLLPIVERLFRVATSLTLLEWCDASKPLLKRLAMEAPGTYNHSLQLGSMCEAAAGAVDARGLIARVGAYYHDIGKLNKPDYFVENQAGSPSKHDKLSPAMSLLVIIGHVKDGLELAEEYGLPKVLHEFIATHHGTTLVQYFYHAATAQRKNGLDRVPEEVEFRYPGPKPQSKEAAILMLADASESSVRAMEDPTPGRIENQVHAMVNHRLMDGQLDECEATLKDVHRIEASLAKSLCGIYHARISYPSPPAPKRGGPDANAKPPGAGAADGSQPDSAAG